MFYLIAPSAYKGTFSPIEIATAIKYGIKQADPKALCQLMPFADGGDGTISALHYILGGEINETMVKGPLGKAVKSAWLKLESPDRDGSMSTIAVVELASASGIAHLSAETLSAMEAQTTGTGQTINACLDSGIQNIYVTLGGSASTDGGMAILIELGAIFLDKDNNALQGSGANLKKVAKVDLSELKQRTKGCNFTIVTDVKNPLCGKQGAAFVYGPQKGANQTQVQELDIGLTNYANVLEETIGISKRELPGSGAAGGVGFGLSIILGAKLIGGFNWLASMTDLRSQILKSDVVISAEGHLDKQSLYGKATGELANLCHELGRPLWMIPARLAKDLDWSAHHIAKIEESAGKNKASLEDISQAAYRLCLSKES